MENKGFVADQGGDQVCVYQGADDWPENEGGEDECPEDATKQWLAEFTDKPKEKIKEEMINEGFWADQGGYQVCGYQGHQGGDQGGDQGEDEE